MGPKTAAEAGASTRPSFALRKEDVPEMARYPKTWHHPLTDKDRKESTMTTKTGLRTGASMFVDPDG